MYAETGSTREIRHGSLFILPGGNQITMASTTKVLIEFETDGSTRHTEGNPTTTVYQLVQSVTTIGESSDAG